MMKTHVMFGIMWCLSATIIHAADSEIVLGENGRSNYQIVLPDSTSDPVIGDALKRSAEVVRAMFAANGFEVPVVRESAKDDDKPGVYLGDTMVARRAGVDASKLPVWSYLLKVVGDDVIVVGRDWAAPNLVAGRHRSCSLGTVKGAADFLRRFCGTRFLAPNGDAGIEFLKMKRIALPVDLDVRKEPALNFNWGVGRPTNDVSLVALNFFNNVVSERSGHTHEIAVSAEAFAEDHPEYFALVNGRRVRENRRKKSKGHSAKEPYLCYSNGEVSELIYRDMIRSFDDGYSEYFSMQPDGFKPCQCAKCAALFDTDSWGEKLWLLNKEWAERLLKDRPGKFIDVGAYTVTGDPPERFKTFPPNLRICAGGYPKAFEKWDGRLIPGGFSAYLHAWGAYHLCGILPTRTPLYAAKTVGMFAERGVKMVMLDSPPALMWGLEGPTVYVYGRMLDDPENHDVKRLISEYLEAAYGRAAGAMERFFETLHHALEAYAEVFGVDNGTFQKYTNADGHSVRYLKRNSKLRLIAFLYPPETLDSLEKDLSRAEGTPGLSRKNRTRLALVRREFDYLKSTARVVHLHNAYLTRKDERSLELLLDEMVKRERMIWSWHDADIERRPGVYRQKPISPEWRMFVGGYFNSDLLRNGGSYLAKPVPPFTWDLAAARGSSLLKPKVLTVVNVDGPLSLNSPEWNNVPVERLEPTLRGADARTLQSVFQIARDKEKLYIRCHGDLPEGWMKPEDKGGDRHSVVASESFDVALSPGDDSKRHFHFAIGPGKEARYDARNGFMEDPLDPRFDQDDVAWNCSWRQARSFQTDEKGWEALFVIPFAELNASAPTKGTEWRFNVGRIHSIRPGAPTKRFLWSFQPGDSSISETNSFGVMRFD